MASTMKRALIILGILASVALGLWLLRARRQDSAPSPFTFVTVTRGRLDTTISSTGTMNPVGSVDVGTQVSGKIDRIMVDFNDTVRKGQVLAVLDTTLLAASVHDAEANIAKAQAAYDQAKNLYERNIVMYQNNYISESDLISFRTQMEAARADLESAQIALKRARTNLGYAVIRSPISGKVIYKNVQEGQTVAASLSTPTLFTIAEDLSRMEIYALVDESDIGKILPGQRVRFTVEAYPDKTFSGEVRQIRLQPTTVQNVVNYTVVVEAGNEDMLLLPGMTATVEFLPEPAPETLLIPNSALRFQPTAEMLQKYGTGTAGNPGTARSSGNSYGGASGRSPRGAQPGGSGGGANASPSAGNSPGSVGRFWILNAQGKLVQQTARIGDTDGRTTVIFPGANVREGMKVIGGAGSSSAFPGGGGQGGIPLGRRMF
jgi:HlyD family secretion protein